MQIWAKRLSFEEANKHKTRGGREKGGETRRDQTTGSSRDMKAGRHRYRSSSDTVVRLDDINEDRGGVSLSLWSLVPDLSVRTVERRSKSPA